MRLLILLLITSVCLCAQYPGISPGGGGGGGSASTGVAGSAQLDAPGSIAVSTTFVKITGGTLVWGGPDSNAGGSAQQLFELDTNNGELKYTGTTAADVVAAFIVNGDISGSASCTVRLYLNDVATKYDVVSNATAAGDFARGSIEGAFTVNENDLIGARISCSASDTVFFQTASLEVKLRGAGIRGAAGAPGQDGVAGTGCIFELTHTPTGNSPTVSSNGNTSLGSICNARTVTSIFCYHEQASSGASGSTDVRLIRFPSSEVFATASITAQSTSAGGTPTAEVAVTDDIVLLDVTAVTSGGTAPQGLFCRTEINTP